MEIDVLIADDHELVRRSVRARLQRDDGIRVVGEARDGRQAIEMAKVLQPDVVIMDISMPRLDGLQALAAIRRRVPWTSVVLLSMYLSPGLVRKAFVAGAAGYVLKRSSDADLLRAVHAAYNGYRFFSVEHDVYFPELARKHVEARTNG